MVFSSVETDRKEPLLLAGNETPEEYITSSDTTTRLSSAPAMPLFWGDAARLAKMLIRIRKIREELVTGVDFSNPGWNMLLDLYVARAAGRRISASSLCIASGVPATTALRWITQMVASKHLARMPDPRDGRRVFISLTPTAADMMDDYFRGITKCFVGDGVRAIVANRE